MSKQDKLIIISHLAGALFFIAALVAAPIGWLALTSAQHETIANTASVPDHN